MGEPERIRRWSASVRGAPSQPRSVGTYPAPTDLLYRLYQQLSAQRVPHSELTQDAPAFASLVRCSAAAATAALAQPQLAPQAIHLGPRSG